MTISVADMFEPVMFTKQSWSSFFILPFVLIDELQVIISGSFWLRLMHFQVIWSVLYAENMWWSDGDENMSWRWVCKVARVAGTLNNDKRPRMRLLESVLTEGQLTVNLWGNCRLEMAFEFPLGFVFKWTIDKLFTTMQLLSHVFFISRYHRSEDISGIVVTIVPPSM